MRLDSITPNADPYWTGASGYTEPNQSSNSSSQWSTHNTYPMGAQPYCNGSAYGNIAVTSGAQQTQYPTTTNAYSQETIPTSMGQSFAVPSTYQGDQQVNGGMYNQYNNTNTTNKASLANIMSHQNYDNTNGGMGFYKMVR